MMQPREFEASAKLQVPKLLAEYLGCPARLAAKPSSRPEFDFAIDAAKRRFEIEIKASGDPGLVQTAISALKKRSTGDRSGPERVPLLVVPFMGPTAARQCAVAGVSWLDLSGNASIQGRDLRVYVTGKPNRFRRRGPAASVFSTRSSRVIRQLLMAPERTYRQKELVELTGLPQGNVSTIVRKLIENGYLRASGRELHVHRPELLLAAWRDKYDFSKHRILSGHVAARSGESLLTSISHRLSRERIDHVATGLAGAWLLTHFAGFRLVTLLVRAMPEDDMVEGLGVRTDSSAPNLWLVVPNDDAVFLGARPSDNLPCAHPIQVYLDLKAQPERAQEAAEELQSRFEWERRRK